MSDIELVIKIPEEMYKRFIKAPRTATFEECIKDRKVFIVALQNGTPISKGHGDLIDRKELIENGISKGLCDWYDEIKMANPIIEAEKEGEE